MATVKLPSPANSGPSVTTKQRVAFQVSPDWAHDAVSLTATSLEVSFDQLRNLYFRLLDQNGVQSQNVDFVTITLKPKLEGRKYHRK